MKKQPSYVICAWHLHLQQASQAAAGMFEVLMWCAAVPEQVFQTLTLQQSSFGSWLSLLESYVQYPGETLEQSYLTSGAVLGMVLAHVAPTSLQQSLE